MANRLSSAAMPRPPRRLVVALLWIAMALLPLRALAAAVMPAATAGVASAAVESAAHDVLQAVPCHGASALVAADADADADADAGTAPAETTHTCSLCDLCHSSVVSAQPPVLALAELPAALPRAAAPSALEPRAPDGLFRPPRIALA